jgi:cytochrome c556
MNRLTGAIGFAVAATTTAALSHSGASGVVLERMNGMTAIRDLMRELSPMMQGSTPYDPIRVSEAGYVIASHSGKNMRALFPNGSLKGVTYAKPNIWSEWEEFSTLSNELRAYAEALSKAAPKGLEPAVAETSETQPDTKTRPLLPATDPSQEIAVLMGYGAPELAAAAPAMPMLSPPALAMIGAERIFQRITGTCSACHSRFRKGRS